MAATAEALPLEGVTAKARRILVVDDDQDFADSIVEFLEARDYSVQVATDDRWAQAVAEDFAPEIALIDIRLGGASGVDLVSALKGRWPELICVMVTAHAEVDEAVKALRAGADDFLTKPLDPAILFATLERGFAKHALIREKLAAEPALRDSELRFRSVPQSAPVAGTCDAAGLQCLDPASEVLDGTRDVLELRLEHSDVHEQFALFSFVHATASSSQRLMTPS